MITMASSSSSGSAVTDIVLDNVSVKFRGAAEPVLNDISLRFNAGQITSLLGPSGCGKSTLLRVIAGLLKPSSGGVTFENAGTSENSQADCPAGRLGYVFQDAALLPWRTVLSNATLPLELLGLYSASERRSYAAEQLTAVGLKADDFRKLPAQLSGGMRMRVSIARALVTNPAILLLDEPFAALDDILRTRLGEMVIQLWRQHPRTIVLVTHNIAEAILLSQRVLVMGSGKIASDIKVDLPFEATEDVRSTEAFSKTYAYVSKVLRSAASEQTQGATANQSRHS